MIKLRGSIKKQTLLKKKNKNRNFGTEAHSDLTEKSQQRFDQSERKIIEFKDR